MSESIRRSLLNKRDVKLALMEKWDRKAATIPGTSKRGSGAGNVRKRKLLTKAAKYRQQVKLLDNQLST